MSGKKITRKSREKKLRDAVDLLLDSLREPECDVYPEAIRKASLKDRVTSVLALCEHLDIHEAKCEKKQPFKIEFSREGD